MEMDRLGEVLREYERLGIRQQINYEKFYLYSIITHSTAIEGSTMTEIENQLLFDEGIAAAKPMPEQLMNLDLKHAYESAFSLAERHEEITPQILCELSALLMKNTGSVYNTIAGTFSSADGDFRLLNVSAGRGGKSYIAWQKVPGRLAEFCSWLNENRTELGSADPTCVYLFSFEAHYRLVSIHPWADGNGRMSRLVMNLLQHEAGLVPSIVKKEKRAAYIQSLAASQESGDKGAFLQFMLEHHIDNIRTQIREYKASTGEEV